MGVGSNSKESVHLLPGQVLMKQELNMHIFKITSWDLKYNENQDGLRVSIVLKRKFVSELMTTYFPSFLLLAITFSTTFFKPFFFEAALGVNLTTMLVMTTIFISKMESLPPTSDIKMIDLWLVFCQMIPFAEVVLLTAMEYQRTAEENHNLEESLKVEVISILSDEANEKEANLCKQINFTLLISTLKAMGELKKITFERQQIIFIPEKRLLPALMLGTAIAYFGVASYIVNSGDP